MLHSLGSDEVRLKYRLTKPLSAGSQDTLLDTKEKDQHVDLKKFKLRRSKSTMQLS